MNKINRFLQSDLWLNMNPVPGAKEALERLVSKGYSIVVVTARGEIQKDATESYLARWFPGSAIDVVNCVGISNLYWNHRFN